MSLHQDRMLGPEGNKFSGKHACLGSSHILILLGFKMTSAETAPEPDPMNFPKSVHFRPQKMSVKKMWFLFDGHILM